MLQSVSIIDNLLYRFKKERRDLILKIGRLNRVCRFFNINKSLLEATNFENRAGLIGFNLRELWPSQQALFSHNCIE